MTKIFSLLAGIALIVAIGANILLAQDYWAARRTAPETPSVLEGRTEALAVRGATVYVTLDVSARMDSYRTYVAVSFAIFVVLSLLYSASRWRRRPANSD